MVADNVNLTNCTIADNSADITGGIHFNRILADKLSLTNCILWNPGEEFGFTLFGEPVLWNCCVQGGWPGDWNIDADPRFVDPEEGDYRLRGGSCCIDAGRYVYVWSHLGRAPDIGAWEAPAEYGGGPCWNVPDVVYVRSDATPGGDGMTWESAFSTIGAAVGVASTSDEVWVAAGRYNESVTMEPRVAFYGGFTGSEAFREERNARSAASILDGTGLGRPVIVGASSSILDGFTVTNGSARFGGGIYCAASSPTLANCVITGNSATAEGGGLYACNGADPLVRDCRVTDNRAGVAGGGLSFRNSSPELVQCVIERNESEEEGGGVACSGSSSPVLTDCVISGNSSTLGGGFHCSGSSSPAVRRSTVCDNTAVEYGGGLCFQGEGSPRIENCVVRGNFSEYGGGLCMDGPTATVANSIIADNSGGSGGGLYASGSPSLANCLIVGNTGGAGAFGRYSSPAFSNCTIVGNTTSYYCGGLVGNDVFLKVHNCILRNQGTEIGGRLWTCSYSCVEGGAPGVGNIDADPRFVFPWDGTVADLRLLPSSPCIDAGTPDMESEDGCLPPGMGSARCDMGAYGGPGNCLWGVLPPPLSTPTPTSTRTPTPTLTPSPTPPVPGDTDGDRTVGASDIFFFARWWETDTNETSFRCDVSGDGRIGGKDLLMLVPAWRGLRED